MSSSNLLKVDGSEGSSGGEVGDDGSGANSLENGSNSSSNGDGVGGVGNNSDNSALVSLGNTSFGFNFDSEEGSGAGSGGGGNGSGASNTSPNNNNNNNNESTASEQNSEEGDSSSSDQETKGTAAAASDAKEVSTKAVSGSSSSDAQSSNKTIVGLPPPDTASVSSKATATGSSSSSHGHLPRSSSSNISGTSSVVAGAAEASASLKSIAAASIKAAESAAMQQQSLKRKSPDPSAENDSTGYNSDDDDEGKTQSGRAVATTKTSQANSVVPNKTLSSASKSSSGGSSKKKKLDDTKREERNAREKERSFRISAQINELRNLLSSGGVIVPKGTKSSVLTEAANYIRMLQQHQYRSEIDRHQLVQQIQMIGGGALGQQAATAVRHVAAQNGVWSLGNFGGVPPKSAMMYHTPGADPATTQESAAGGETTTDGSVLPNKIVETDYRYVFNACGVGMAIASMGGAFIDCNRLFSQLSNYSKQEVCSMTVFNLTARQDLQSAFDLISQMLSAPTELGSDSSASCVLRGSFKHRTDLGLSVSLIKGEDGVAKCFCVTLIMNPESPFDVSPPIPATIDLVTNGDDAGGLSVTKDQTRTPIETASQPAYTTG